jgi:hypothetical protein
MWRRVGVGTPNAELQRNTDQRTGLGCVGVSETMTRALEDFDRAEPPTCNSGLMSLPQPDEEFVKIRCEQTSAQNLEMQGLHGEVPSDCALALYWDVATGGGLVRSRQRQILRERLPYRVTRRPW